MQNAAGFVHVAGTESVEARTDESGQTMAEYGVVLALVTLAVVGSLTLLSGSISSAFSSVAGLLP